MHWRKARKIEETILGEKGAGAVLGKCYFCGEEIDGMFYCFGCKEFVCAKCDETQECGLHRVEDHKAVPNS